MSSSKVHTTQFTTIDLSCLALGTGITLFALNLTTTGEGLCFSDGNPERTGFRDKLECPLGTTVRPRMTVV